MLMTKLDFLFLRENIGIVPDSVALSVAVYIINIDYKILFIKHELSFWSLQ